MTFLRLLMACSGAVACFGTAVVLVWCSGKAYGHETLLTKSKETSLEHQSNSAADESPTDSVPPFSGSSCSARPDSDRFLLIISTMDGYVTAVNAVTGVEEWSISTGTNPLLSSSISKLEMLRAGQRKRLIPSLDGGLFQFDGEGIEPVPLAADILLSSSFRFTDDSTVVGGKDVETYGIDLKKGKVRYVCSTSGCKYFDGHPASFRLESDLGDVLVVSRTTKTVRAVDLLTGAEKWNFSVGQHDLSYASPLPKMQEVTQQVVVDNLESRDATTESAEKPSEAADKTFPVKDSPSSGETEDCSDQCDVQTDEDEIKAEDTDGQFVWSKPVSEVLDIDLKVVVPSGQILAVDPLSPAHVHWQRKFKSPIAAAWVLRNKKLSELSLFDNRNVPALEDQHETDSNSGSQTADCPSTVDEPLLYIGAFEGQLYVQPSVRMMQEVEVATSNAIQHGIIDMPRVKWRPYVSTAPSRTPAASVPKNQLVAVGSESTPQSTAVMQWHEQYPFEEGFYLFPDYTPVNNLKLLPGNSSTTSDNDNDITVSLLNWWKEILGISSVMSVVINLLIHRCLRRNTQNAAEKSPTQSQQMTAELVVLESAVDVTAGEKLVASASCQQLEYISRYTADFEQEACLGRGGFGVVFRAKNRLDDCIYAIKRITLHDSERARQKVTREVKALAKLDHPGIVRYYQSWFESPPPGWQEDQDKIWIDLSLQQTPGFTPTGAQSSAECVPTALAQRSKRPCRRKRAQPNHVNPMRLLESSFESRCTNPLLSGFNESSNNEPLDHSSDISGTESDQGPSSSVPKKLSTDSGTENDSFEVAFQDDSFSDRDNNKKLFNCSNSNKRQQNQDTDDSSLNIVFEDSAANLDCVPSTASVNGTGPFGEPNVSLLSSSPPDRPQTLDLQQRLQEKIVESRSRTGKEAVQKLYLFIQMQLCQPESLKDWLNGNTLNRDKYQLRDIFHQIVSAIGYVHNCGMMHRDLKPSNIFFAMDGSVKIGDFGLVTAVEENCSNDSFIISPVATPVNRGRHTDQVGTKLYMSPEQCAGQNYTHKVDIYALGMIFFELFYPFATEMERTKVLVDVRQLKFPPRFLRELTEEASFVRPLLSHEPDTRPSAKKILEHPIVMDFEQASQAIRRLHSQSRLRTMSSSSGNSHGDGCSQKSAEEENVM